MAADDDANSALIAQLLMQDQLQDRIDGDNPYTRGFEEDEDDDYIPQSLMIQAQRKGFPKLSKFHRKAPEERKRRTKEEIQKEEGSKKRKKKKESKRPDGGEWSTGKWSEEEEKRFREALELYGRDWKRVTEMIQTREKEGVRSHAQKYFIKLYQQNLPLPAKVQESGAGHTLSGKPLDPNSGAAQQYLGLKPRKKQEKKVPVNGQPSNKTSGEDKPEEDSQAKDIKAESGTEAKETEKKDPIRSPRAKRTPLREANILGGNVIFPDVPSRERYERQAAKRLTVSEYPLHCPHPQVIL